MRPTRLLPLLLVLAVAPAGAELYRWTDAQGRMHVTMHLDEVPPAHRPAAVAKEMADRSAPARVQSFAAPPGGAASYAPRAGGGSASDDAQRVYHVRVARASSGMIVKVRINDRVTAPFLIDTGASDVLLPKHVADELGIQPGPDMRTQLYQTANGVVSAPVLTLDSVEVGGARVEDVPASIGNMSVGLLGLSFFNHFTYRIDAAAGIVTLSPNRLAESGLLRGGRSASQWRSQFGSLKGQIAQVAAMREATPSADGRRGEKLEAAQRMLERQLEQLEDEADLAHVPASWRD